MLNSFFQALVVLFNLCRLNGSPKLLPYSIELLVLFLIGEIALTTQSLRHLPLPGVSFTHILISTVLSMIIYAAIVYALLAQRKFQARAVQVLIALFGTELMIELVLKVLDLTLMQTLSNIQYIEIGLSLFFITWKILIVAYILRQSLEVKTVTSVLMTFCIMIASSLPMNLIFSQYYQDTQMEGK